jgi:hypothetical protein
LFWYLSHSLLWPQCCIWGKNSYMKPSHFSPQIKIKLFLFTWDIALSKCYQSVYTEFFRDHSSFTHSILICIFTVNSWKRLWSLLTGM